jgi:two-component system, chemotaxis family, chemotaxis protein CheY
MAKKMLVIDDEALIVKAMTVIFQDLGHVVNAFTDPVKGAAEGAANDYDLIITDLRMPVRNGAEVTRTIRAAKPAARILVITAYENDPLVEEALAAGALGALKKPFEITKIMGWLAAEPPGPTP